ncbi:uncharacterized protein TRIADDRAFT_58010 [Trichoplax adhaerens]|uniref:Rhodanese domain-containing protein n=1 Tax=Trichoplax adhaerens TaxID=10228 RepID=B3S2F8_TRIAD|nr:hypothetical protein TRIADDRAFT_58010 [Trichoplax adhaerens]EDV23410.1 hypothetical protein TRIADDRAFT_58010 [Trichoplax adhaerens]|eukprot:XP_002114320.1 hypothetical protein TRIADDRAFT_58010 [Trichoplax adhaerens]
MDEISYEDLVSLIETKNIQLFDVRTPEEIAKYGKIAHSVNVPVHEIRDALQMSAEAFQDKYSVAKPTMDSQHLIFHCQSGKRSRMALDAALQLGYSNARHYRQGFLGWLQRQENTNNEMK